MAAGLHVDAQPVSVPLDFGGGETNIANIQCGLAFALPLGQYSRDPPAGRIWRLPVTTRDRVIIW